MEEGRRGDIYLNWIVCGINCDGLLEPSILLGGNYDPNCAKIHKNNRIDMHLRKLLFYKLSDAFQFHQLLYFFPLFTVKILVSISNYRITKQKLQARLKF